MRPEFANEPLRTSDCRDTVRQQIDDNTYTPTGKFHYLSLHPCPTRDTVYSYALDRPGVTMYLVIKKMAKEEPSG